MPIEIRELIIKASINRPLADPKRDEQVIGDLSAFKKEIIEDVMEKVNKLIEKKTKR